MADLDLGPRQDSGNGKGIAIAGVVMVAIAAAVYLLSPRTTAKVTVTHVALVAPHVESKAIAGSIKVLGTPASSEDALYVAVDLNIENVRSTPLYLTGETAKVEFADGEMDATVVPPSDMPRIEPSFPALTPLLQHPLAVDTTVPAKGSTEGTVLLLLPGQTEAAWKTRKSATLTLLLAHDDQQTVAIP